MIKFLDLNKQYNSIKNEVDTAIESVIKDSAFISGPYVEKFESEFSKYCNAKYCIGVGNGTDALEIILRSLELPLESEVIVPGNSFIATSEAVTREGLRVVFADVDKEDYTFDVDDVISKITKKTSAIIAVHLYGHPCDMDRLKEVCDKKKILIIEDCAQAHGAEYKKKRVGSIGVAGAFSFYPGKNLGCFGDGGAITTNNETIAKRARMIANHGRSKKYDHEFEGRNSRLDAIQAAILSVKLKSLEKWNANRIKISEVYLEGLKNIEGLILPKRKDYAKQVYHLFVIRVDQRESLKEYLMREGIQVGVHYPISLPKLNAYRYIGQDKSDMFVNKCDTQLLSLPIGDQLTTDEAKQVVVAIKRFYQ